MAITRSTFAGPRRRQCSPRFSLFSSLSFFREFDYRFTLFSGKKETNLHLVFWSSQNASYSYRIFVCIYIYIYEFIVFIYLYMYIYMQSLTRVYLQLFTSRFYISGKALSTIRFVGPLCSCQKKHYSSRLSYTQVVTILTAPSWKTLHIYFFRSFRLTYLLLEIILVLFFSLSLSLFRFPSFTRRNICDHSLFTMQKL